MPIPNTVHGILALLPADRILFQKMDDALIGWQKTRQGWKLSLLTDQEPNHKMMARRGTMAMEKFGMVLWLDRSDLATIENQRLPEAVSRTHYDALAQVMAGLTQLGELKAFEQRSGVPEDVLKLLEQLREPLAMALEVDL